MSTDETTIVSDPTTKVGTDDDDLDRMVRKASTPNLATLFQRGKDQGLITGVTAYGEKS